MLCAAWIMQIDHLHMGILRGSVSGWNHTNFAITFSVFIIVVASVFAINVNVEIDEPVVGSLIFPCRFTIPVIEIKSERSCSC